MYPKFLIAFLFSFVFLSHANGQYFEGVAYKRWRIHMNNGRYSPARTQAQSGNYHIHTLPVRGFTVGFEYYFRRNYALQWFTGLNMHFIPLDNYEYELPGKEIGFPAPYYYDNTFRQIRDRHNVLSIPLGMLYNIARQGRFSYHVRGGVNLDLIQYGAAGKTYSITDDNGISKEYLNVEMLSDYKNVVYPALFLGAGVDYNTRWSNYILPSMFKKH